MSPVRPAAKSPRAPALNVSSLPRLSPAAAQATEAADLDVARALHRCGSGQELDAELSDSPYLTLLPRLRCADKALATASRKQKPVREVRIGRAARTPRMAGTFRENFWAPQSADNAIYRGSDVEVDFELKKQEDLEFARYRHTTTQQWSSRERKLVQRRRDRSNARGAKIAELKFDDEEENEYEMAEEEEEERPKEPVSTRSGREFSRSFSSADGGGLGLADKDKSKSSVASPSKRGAICMTCPIEFQRFQKRVDHTQRVKALSVLRRARRKENAQNRLMAFRSLQFDDKSQEERDQLTKAFNNADSQAHGVLDATELLRACIQVGVVPRTDLEMKACKVVCNELVVCGEVDLMAFTFEAIPRLRSRLQEMRRTALRQHFDSCDLDGSGLLSEEECEMLLKKLCAKNLDSKLKLKIQDAFAKVMATAVDDSGEVSFDNFELLVTKLQEHHQRIVKERLQEVAQEERLPPEDVLMHAEEIVAARDLFERVCQVEKTDLLNERALRVMLTQYSVMPADLDWDGIMELSGLHRCAEERDCNFREFLKVLRTMRGNTKAKEYDHILAMFEKADRDKSGSLCFIEIFELIADLGLAPRSRDEQIEMQMVIKSIDTDGSGELNFYEFGRLITLLEDRVTAAMQHSVLEYAVDNQISDRELFTVVEAFLTYGGNGSTCKVQGLRSILDRLRCNLSGEQLANLMTRFDRDKKGELNILAFLQLVWTAKLDLNQLEAIMLRGSLRASICGY